MDKDLQKRYAEWKAKTSDPKNKDRNKSLSQYMRNQLLSNDPDWIESNKIGAKKRKELYYDDPQWINQHNILANNPNFAKEISKKQWENPERKCQHLEQLQRSIEAGAFKKDIEHKLNLAKAKMKSDIMTPFGQYDSFYAFNIDYPNINVRDRMRLNPHQYYYTVDGPGEPTYEDVYYSEFGVHKYMKTLFEIAKQKDPENTQCKSQKDWFYKMCRKYPDKYYKKREIKREWDLEKP